MRSWQELDPGAVVLAEAGARPMDADAADDLYLRTFAAPAVDVNGIQGGEPVLTKTVLPVLAEANVSIRLAPGQDAERDRRRLRAAPPRRLLPRAPSSRSSGGRPVRPG